MATLLTPLAAIADDLRERQLENEVSRLQRELDAQSRRLDELERTARTPSSPAVGSVRTPARTEDSPAWLVNTNWDRLRPGMKELDVISLLGRPTTVRPDPDARTRSFLYAMELGPTAVLAGRVRFGDAGVVEIVKPTLR